MSALPPKADIIEGCNQCLLMTQSGHSVEYAVQQVGPENQGFQYPCYGQHWRAPGSKKTLCEKLIKIGAKVVRHGRYITFQLAEVAIPRSLFANILRLIDGLRPAPLPP